MSNPWLTEFDGFEQGEISVRAASEADSRTVFELCSEGLRPYVEPVWGWDEEDQRERHCAWWEPQKLIVFERAGRLAGVLSMSEREGDDDITRIVVDKSLRGRGVGTAIVRRVQDVASSHGRGVMLQVIEGNPAIRLYERLGFPRPKSSLRRSACGGRREIKRSTTTATGWN